MQNIMTDWSSMAAINDFAEKAAADSETFLQKSFSQHLLNLNIWVRCFSALLFSSKILQSDPITWLKIVSTDYTVYILSHKSNSVLNKTVKLIPYLKFIYNLFENRCSRSSFSPLSKVDFNN